MIPKSVIIFFIFHLYLVHGSCQTRQTDLVIDESNIKDYLVHNGRQYIACYKADNEPFELPATNDNKTLIVDPVPVKGGIINLAAKLCLDRNLNPVFAYHKYDAEGNLQLYFAEQVSGKWFSKQVTHWVFEPVQGEGLKEREAYLIKTVSAGPAVINITSAPGDETITQSR